MVAFLGTLLSEVAIFTVLIGGVGWYIDWVNLSDPIHLLVVVSLSAIMATIGKVLLWIP